MQLGKKKGASEPRGLHPPIGGRSSEPAGLFLDFYQIVVMGKCVHNLKEKKN